jgi:hypothetical protein
MRFGNNKEKYKKVEKFVKKGLHFDCIFGIIIAGTSLRCAGTQRHKSKRR